MNKYQEALNKLKELGLSIPANGQGEECGFSPGFDFNHDGYETECSLMQELADKETPMKTHRAPYPYHANTYCGSCKEMLIFKYKHCPNCGQKIDWSDEE